MHVGDPTFILLLFGVATRRTMHPIASKKTFYKTECISSIQTPGSALLSLFESYAKLFSFENKKKKRTL
jgi:hypothetical protein